MITVELVATKRYHTSSLLLVDQQPDVLVESVAEVVFTDVVPEQVEAEEGPTGQYDRSEGENERCMKTQRDAGTKLKTLTHGKCLKGGERRRNAQINPVQAEGAAQEPRSGDVAVHDVLEARRVHVDDEGDVVEA